MYIGSSLLSKKILLFLTYIIIVFSALAFFKQDLFRIIISITFVSLFLMYRQRIDIGIFFVILYLIIILAGQAIMWNMNIALIIGSIIYFGILPYLFLKVLGINFPRFYVLIMYYYCIISLIFWSVSNISPSFHNLTSGFAGLLGTHPIDPDKLYQGKPEQFILYTYEAAKTFGIIRNPGPFHEPGAFGVFLLLAIVFNTMITHNFFDRKNLIMIFAILTTFSTAGILGLMIAFLSYYYGRKKLIRLSDILTMLVFLPLFTYIYLETPFLNDKIQDQYQIAQNTDLNKETTGRFVGFRKSLNVIKKYPLGRGLTANTKANVDSSEYSAYGILSFGARIGIIGFLFYLFYFYRSIKQFCIMYSHPPRFAIGAFLALLVVLSSQTYAETPIFMMIFYSSLIWGNFGIKFRDL